MPLHKIIYDLIVRFHNPTSNLVNFLNYYRIPLFSHACFNTMSRIFGAWSNIDLTICDVRVMFNFNY
ncbi:hypothetical protein BpHYR1_031321 [Brachionus plicatilis]|uniref:Uncharacterized protein n=1 Tax=Brachionus plicatilis TaxID=10195 RepID=A0A3M7QSK6_BRAPC|nr:hypothetical protein BpHYR1_031321 [Brachionus plicatilis]